MAEAELYDLCCSSCGTCGGQRLFEGFDKSIVSLRAMGALVCRDARDEAVRDLDLLVEATIPRNVDESYERLRENDSPVDTYRWDSRGESFLLTTSIFERQQRWIGTLEVTRCEKSADPEEWILDDGSAVEILYYVFDADGVDDRWLHLTYATRCTLATDTPCVESEMQRVWDRLKLESDLADVDIIALEAEDCRLKSDQTLLMKKNGTWPVSIVR